MQKKSFKMTTRELLEKVAMPFCEDVLQYVKKNIREFVEIDKAKLENVLKEWTYPVEGLADLICEADLVKWREG